MANTLISHETLSPSGITETCAKFAIDNVTKPFIFSNLVIPNQEYTFSFWAKSDASGSIIAANRVFSISTEWTRYVLTYTSGADEVDFQIVFNTAGTYYLYHTQMETGNKATDWSPNPDDVQEDIDDAKEDITDIINKQNDAQLLIDKINAQISSFVVGPNGETLATQTEDGFYYQFDINPLVSDISSAKTDIDTANGKLEEADKALSTLNELVDDISKRTAYINMLTDENGDPYIELGRTDSAFKVRITNTSVDFIEGTEAVAYINNQSLYITKAIVKQELRVGESPGYVWKTRNNGNMGLVWIK